VAADDEVERLGSHGSHPDIQAAAERVVDAHRRRDLQGVRAACAEVVTAAQRSASGSPNSCLDLVPTVTQGRQDGNEMGDESSARIDDPRFRPWRS
jgi:hypothetical protein